MKYNILVLCALIPACVGEPPTASLAPIAATGAPYQTDRLSPNVTPTGYQVSLTLDPKQPEYSGEVAIAVTLRLSQNEIWLHSLEHTITRAQYTTNTGKTFALSTARQGTDWLGLAAQESLPAGSGVLELSFEGAMTKPLFGMYRVKSEENWYIFSQMEALGAREAFPCFDEPRFKVPFDVSLVLPSEDRAFFNTPSQKVSRNNGQATHQFATSKPLPTYLLAFAVGPLDVLHDPEHDIHREDGSVLQVRVIAAAGKAHLAKMALRETKSILAIEESYFGTPYPYAKLDLVAVPDFEAGAMENPGLITYRDSLLLFDEATVTERQLARFANTHAHELAHIWFGDLVTMPWWDDLWLNEAFATWFAGKVVSQYRPDWQSEIDSLRWFTWVMEQDSNPRSRRIREPIATRGDIENAFDGITYGKGYAVLAMFENLIGEAAFQAGIRTYLQDHAWDNATSADLIAALERAAGRKDFSSAFRTFLDQPGVPVVAIEPGECVNEQLTVTLSQKRWQPLGGARLEAHQWQVPICLQAGDGGEKVCTILKQDRERLVLPTCPDTLIPNPGGVAYSLWTLPAPWINKLLEGLAAAPEIDRVSAIGNLTMLYEAGSLSATDLLAIAPAMLSHQSPRVRLGALALIGKLDALVTDDLRGDWHTWLASLLAPLVQEIGWGAPGEKAAKALWDLRRKLLKMAGAKANLPSVVKEATQRSEAFLKGEEINRELAGTALSIFAKKSEPGVFKEIQVIFENETDIFRRSILRSALTSFTHKDLVEPMITYAFSDALKDNEREKFIFAPSRNPDTRVQAWESIKPRLQEIRALLPSHSARYLPYLLSNHCSEAAVKDLDTAFLPWLTGPDDERVPGLDRHVSATRNKLERCRALRQQHSTSLETVIRRHHDI